MFRLDFVQHYPIYHLCTATLPISSSRPVSVDQFSPLFYWGSSRPLVSAKQIHSLHQSLSTLWWIVSSTYQLASFSLSPLEGLTTGVRSRVSTPKSVLAFSLQVWPLHPPYHLPQMLYQQQQPQDPQPDVGLNFLLGCRLHPKFQLQCFMFSVLVLTLLLYVLPQAPSLSSLALLASFSPPLALLSTVDIAWWSYLVVFPTRELFQSIYQAKALSHHTWKNGFPCLYLAYQENHLSSLTRKRLLPTLNRLAQR